MDISARQLGERIAQAVATRASAEAVLAETERQPSLFIVSVNVLCVAGSTAMTANHFGSQIDAWLGALAGAAFALALASYSNGLRQRRRVDAMFRLLRETAS